MLAGFSRNVSHQEIERILGEVEQWYSTAKDQAGVDWLPLKGIENFLFNDLGYEDVDEFEDAIQGSFESFLASFPHFEVKEEDGKSYLKINEIKKAPARKLTLSVTSSKQLLDTCLLKAVDAQVEIPHLEFVIGPEQKRHIDSLYQHIAEAAENIEQHAQMLGDSPDERAKVVAAAEGLRALLDVEEPFELIVLDPQGLSEFNPADGVRIEEL
eukprot:TRINITY_DN62935_c0_g1_i1.p1 TRINITY_DN62935_c0_g1~~TRINITY_DN62935_c0_g1_i1.p1  ORF type:complete len:221 (+),score=56.95 TRINITY_DN62935_c0_g1_i1:26-664(+)